MDYKKSGVDVEAGDALVDWLQQDLSVKDASGHGTSGSGTSGQKSSPSVDSTKPALNRPSSEWFANQSKIIDGIGGFAALFRADFSKYQKPALVACTDGVGTKVKLASYFNDYSKVGYDLVGMCVNDLLCTGGDPLFFLDYYATGKLNLDHAKEFLTSVRRACQDSDLVLIGGETAEMPGVYQQGDFDCAGFAIGVVDEEHRWGAHRVKPGQVCLGLPSSGYHSNGFSLLRKIFADDFATYRDWLMEPTRLYVQIIKLIRQKYKIKAAAHITGGGVDNLPRVIAQDQAIALEPWSMPSAFLEVQKRANLKTEEMLRTFNCGIGFVLIVDAEQADAVLTDLKKWDANSRVVGHVVARTSEEQILYAK